MKIGVFGSHELPGLSHVASDSYEIGNMIASDGHILITGASKGVSEFAAKGALYKSGLVVGISPEYEIEPKSNSIDHKNQVLLIRTGLPYKMRNVITVINCDVCIFISGAEGTLSEFSIALEYKKPCIVLKKSGGFCDVVESIIKALNKYNHRVHYADTVEKAYSLAVSINKK